MKKQHKHYLTGTKIPTYPAATVAKSSELNSLEEKLLIETTIGQAKHILLLGAIIKLKLIDELHNFSQIIEGLNAGDSKSYKHTDGYYYSVDYPDYTTDPKLATEQMTSKEILPIKDVFAAYFKLMKKNKSFCYIQTKEFLQLRSHDEELAALLGTINELVLEGEESFKEQHIGRIYTAINNVFLQGYPPQKMLA